MHTCNDFVTGTLRAERSTRIITPLKKLMKAARKKGVPIIFSSDAHYMGDFEVVHKWGGHAIKGTPGAEVIPELQPKEGDLIVEKRTYSACMAHEEGLKYLQEIYNAEITCVDKIIEKFVK